MASYSPITPRSSSTRSNLRFTIMTNRQTSLLQRRGQQKQRRRQRQGGHRIQHSNIIHMQAQASFQVRHHKRSSMGSHSRFFLHRTRCSPGITFRLSTHQPASKSLLRNTAKSDLMQSQIQITTMADGSDHICRDSQPRDPQRLPKHLMLCSRHSPSKQHRETALARRLRWHCRSNTTTITCRLKQRCDRATIV